MPKYLSGDPPPKKKPASTIAQALAGAVQRADPTAIPRAPRPRLIPEISAGQAAGAPPGSRWDVRQVVDPDEQLKRPPFPAHLARESVPEELQWQAGFLDTLSQLVGATPGRITAEPYPADYTAGRFVPKGRRITLSGNIIPSKFEQPGSLRWTGSHEFGHLLVNDDNAIIQAFMRAAPLPKRLNAPDNGPEAGMAELWNVGFKDGQRIIDTTRAPNWGREYIANEAFADMFADALAKKLPQIGEPGRSPNLTHYSFTDQFRGRPRQRMVDSLVNVLTERLK